MRHKKCLNLIHLSGKNWQPSMLEVKAQYLIILYCSKEGQAKKILQNALDIPYGINRNTIK